MQTPNNKPVKKKKVINVRAWAIGIVIFAYIIVMAISLAKDCKPTSGQLTYQELIDGIQSGEIVKVNIVKDQNAMTVVKADGSTYDAVNPKSDDFIEKLWSMGAEVNISKTTATDAIATLLGTLPLMVVMAIFAIYLSNTIIGGNTKAFTLLKTNDNKTTFDDIRGLSETKKEIQFAVDSIKNYKKINAMGAKTCNGILLEGPPGTGKTMLAKAIANAAGVNFISASGSDFNEMFVGVGAARVRALWELAQTNAPCIIFIDEIDCLGKRRRGGDGASNELSQTLNCLLQKMDGLNKTNGIMVIGATNRKQDLDKALLRPGRFDRQYFIGPPTNKKDRDEIVEMYLSNKKLEDGVTLDKVSKLLVGLTGAEIENTLSEAVYVSFMNDRNGIIGLSDIDDAIMRHITSGVKKEHTSERDKKIVAYHEAGHTLVYLLNDIPVSKVSIVPYSTGVGGVTIRDTDDKEDKKLKTFDEYNIDLMVLLAGKIAEEVTFGQHTQGCSNDIQEATKLVYQMITQYGFCSSTLVNQVTLINEGLKLDTENDLLEKCNEHLKEINDITTKAITDNIDKLNKIAKDLLNKQVLVCPTLADYDD